MFIVKERYPLHYFEGDCVELVPALHDTFFQEKNGQVFAQFHTGQLISREVFDRIWGTTQVIAPEVQEEVVEEIQVQFEPEVKPEETQEEVQPEKVEETKEEEVKEEVLELEPEKEQPTKEEVPESKGKAKKKK